MAITLHLILLAAACVCFAIAAFGVSSRIGLVPLGLLLLTLAFVF